jgi:hypothetical protein
MIKLWELRRTLERVQGPNSYEPSLTHLKQIESIHELDPTLHLGSSNHELCFLAPFFFGRNQLIFPPKLCHVSLALICHFLVLDPHLKAMSLNQWSYYLMKVALGRDCVAPLGTMWELTLTNDHLLGITSIWKRLCHIIGNFVHNLLDSWCSMCQWQAFERAFEPKRKLRVKYGNLSWVTNYGYMVDESI